MAGIPTLYRHRCFRSRLEARWAAFFDLLGWPWEYEPIDLRGYIPDFVLCLPTPVLVEVKCEFTTESLAAHGSRIDASGWAGPALMVGARLWRLDESPWACVKAQLGLGNGVLTGFDSGWDEADVGACASGHPSLASESGAWHCWVCGTGGKAWYQGTQDVPVRAMWAEAGNAVQWQAQPG